jgi:hypothetical protein
MAKPIGSAKTGGRQKGIPNKNSFKLEEILGSYNYNPLHELLKKYPLLDIENQIKIDLKILEYIYPRLKSTDLKITQEKNPYDNMTVEEMAAEHEKLYRENSETLLQIFDNNKKLKELSTGSDNSEG